jgi:galactokinase
MHLLLPEFIESVPDAKQRITHLSTLYQQRFGAHPTVVASAPGRTEIIGNHTDHNHGRVVAAAISLDTIAVAGRSADTVSHLISSGWDDEFSVDLTGTGDADHDTPRLMRGVAAGLTEAGLSAPAYNAVVESRVAPGSGLSSSAAFEMTLAGVHAALDEYDLDPVVAARVGQFAENRYMGKPSGLMDQMASAIGGAVAIDFAEPDRPRYHRLDLDFRSQSLCLFVVNTGGSHADLTEHYAAVPREMRAVAAALGVETLNLTTRRELLAHLSKVREAAGDRAVLRAFHFFDEQDRVSTLIDAVDSRLGDRVLHAMIESGTSSWTLLQNVYPGDSIADQSLAVALQVTRTYLAARGATGAYRVHGGGFAGTILAAIPESLADEYRTAMDRAFGAGSALELSIRSAGLVTAPL